MSNICRSKIQLFFVQMIDFSILSFNLDYMNKKMMKTVSGQISLDLVNLMKNDSLSFTWKIDMNHLRCDVFLTLMKGFLLYTIIHVFYVIALYSSSSCDRRIETVRIMQRVIGGYRAVTIQCRWNLTSIAYRNNDTRLRNREFILNSQRKGGY